MTDIDDLDLGEPKVEPICEQLALSEETTQAAKEQARRVDREYPINHKGSIVAASSVYFQGLMQNEKVTQKQVAEVSDAHRHSIRECYPKIAEAEGLETEHTESESEPEELPMLGEPTEGTNASKEPFWKRHKLATRILEGVVVFAGFVIVFDQLLSIEPGEIRPRPGEVGPMFHLKSFLITFGVTVLIACIVMLATLAKAKVVNRNA